MKHHLLLLLPTLLCLAAAPATKPSDRFEPYTEHVEGTLTKFDMLPIPAGKFTFSADGKAVPKAIEIKRFLIAKTECTWDQFDTFYHQLDLPQRDRHFLRAADAKTRPSNPYVAPDFGFGHDGFPVICVTAHTGKMYCQWLSEKTGRKYRLPTPAEWEYACRAGGAEVRANAATAWTSENSPNQQTQPVATKKPNAFGLFDMLGNVGEWTITPDGKDEYLYGGHFFQSARQITSATRDQLNLAWAIRAAANPPSKWWLSDGPFAGFRVVREE